MNFLYITADVVGTVSGGGIVTRKESEALKELGDVNIIDRTVIDPSGIIVDPFEVDLAAERIVASILENRSIDLVHFYSGTFTNTIRLLKQYNTKVTYTAAAHDRATSIKEFELLAGEYPHKHIKDDKLWEKYLGGYKLADLLICPSSHSLKVMSGYGCNSTVVIPHGIEPIKEVKDFPKIFKVGYFGQLGPDKGVIYLLKAWKKLDYKDSILIIGGHNSEDALHLIRSNGGGGNVHIVGGVKDISEFYNECSIYVQPSVSEGYGISILEALGHGRPVISSIGAGACDAIDDGVEGFRVPIRSPGSIAEKIDWFKKRPEAIKIMGKNAILKAENYRWEDIKEAYKITWNKLLKSVENVPVTI